ALPPPAPEVLARVAAQIRRAMGPRLLLRAVPLGAALAFALLAAVMHTRADEFAWLQAIVVAGAATLFGITAVLRASWALFATAVGSLLFALTAQIGSGAADWATGAHCMATELAGAAVPLAITVALVVSKKTAAIGAAGFGAAAGVGALAAQAALHLACPV